MHHTIQVTPGCHTLGNLLLDYLLENKTMFCAYKVPHPLSKSVEFTMDATDNRESLARLRGACKKAFDQLSSLEEQFGKHIGCSSMPIDYEPTRFKMTIRKGRTVSDKSMS